MMEALEKISKSTARVARDMNSFGEMQAKVAGSAMKRDLEGFAERLDSTSELVGFGSMVLTTCMTIRFELLHLATITGASEFKPQARALAQDLNEMIQNLRTVLSALTERNRAVRDRYAVYVSQERLNQGVEDPSRRF